jgi:hypothetical protein
VAEPAFERSTAETSSAPERSTSSPAAGPPPEQAPPQEPGTAEPTASAEPAASAEPTASAEPATELESPTGPPTEPEAAVEPEPGWVPVARPLPVTIPEPPESSAQRALLRELSGNRAGAERLYERAAIAGNLDAFVGLARLRAEAAPPVEDDEEIEKFIDQAVIEGNTAVLFGLAAAGHHRAVMALAKLRDAVIEPEPAEQEPLPDGDDELAQPAPADEADPDDDPDDESSATR